jgi:hypothetical protein
MSRYYRDVGNRGSDLCELWHRRMAHLRHGALRVLREMVTGVPDFNSEHHDLCKGCALESTPRLLFRAVAIEQQGYLILYIQMYVAQCLRHR